MSVACLCLTRVTSYKLLSVVLQRRLEHYAEEALSDCQAGFRRNRSTTDHIFAVRTSLAKRREFRRDTHLIFVDFTKAYDSVIRGEPWKRLEERGIPVKLVTVMKALFRKKHNRGSERDPQLEDSMAGGEAHDLRGGHKASSPVRLSVLDADSAMQGSPHDLREPGPQANGGLGLLLGLRRHPQQQGGARASALREVDRQRGPGSSHELGRTRREASILADDTLQPYT
ncbi:hypothetical protein FOCC_FOCC007306 [Frankliniella occidentalis]|nr:hypothetical protein FOCC_FOCC007306 [Frankliniella occidentalis]